MTLPEALQFLADYLVFLVSETSTYSALEALATMQYVNSRCTLHYITRLLWFMTLVIFMLVCRRKPTAASKSRC